MFLLFALDGRRQLCRRRQNRRRIFPPIATTAEPTIPSPRFASARAGSTARSSIVATGVGDRSDYKFLWAGFQLGKPLTPVLHAGIFSGQFEFGGNIMPLWQAYTPAAARSTTTPALEPRRANDAAALLPVGGGTFRGVSLTPVIFRWNFLTRSRRIQPWFQGAGGLIYTTHKFPPNLHELSGPTATPTAERACGTFRRRAASASTYFTRAKRSIDLGVNGVHISSASLGDRNPGVNASIQVQVGYTFWK